VAPRGQAKHKQGVEEDSRAIDIGRAWLTARVAESAMRPRIPVSLESITRSLSSTIMSSMLTSSARAYSLVGSSGKGVCRFVIVRLSLPWNQDPNAPNSPTNPTQQPRPNPQQPSFFPNFRKR
jgi:hypothetical protein